MSEFLQWEGWNAVSSICQIVIAMCAVWAICVTIGQIGNKKKIRIDVNVRTEKLYIGSRKQEIFLAIEIFNFGMSPVYIKECWISGCEYKDPSSENSVKLISDPGFLKPGECKVFSNEVIEEAITDTLLEKYDEESLLSKMYSYLFLEDDEIKKLFPEDGESEKLFSEIDESEKRYFKDNYAKSFSRISKLYMMYNGKLYLYIENGQGKRKKFYIGKKLNDINFIIYY